MARFQDLFSEVKNVAEGRLVDKKFLADRILAKHDEIYTRIKKF